MNFYHNIQFTYLEGFQIRFDSSDKTLAHTSQSHQLFYLKEGEATFTIKGSTIALKKNELCLIPVNTSYTYQSTGQFFHCQFDARTYDTRDLFEFIQIPYVLKPDTPLLSEQLFERLIKTTQDDDFERSTILQLLLCPFLKHAEKNKCSKAEDRLLPVFDYIAKNIQYSPKIEDLANLLQLDKGYFTSLFRKTMGISPGQYIQQEKIKVACSMLQNHQKVSTITQELDFYDTSHFCRIFKKEMGETPKQFLKRINQE